MLFLILIDTRNAEFIQTPRCLVKANSRLLTIKMFLFLLNVFLATLWLQHNIFIQAADIESNNGPTKLQPAVNTLKEKSIQNVDQKTVTVYNPYLDPFFAGTWSMPVISPCNPVSPPFDPNQMSGCGNRSLNRRHALIDPNDCVSPRPLNTVAGLGTNSQYAPSQFCPLLQNPCRPSNQIGVQPQQQSQICFLKKQPSIRNGKSAKFASKNSQKISKKR